MTNSFDYSSHRPPATPVDPAVLGTGRRRGGPPRGRRVGGSGSPVRWLGAALVVAVAALVVVVVAFVTTGTSGGRILPMSIGWVLAGPAAIGLLAVHARADAADQAVRIVAPPTWARTLYWIVLAVAFAGIGISAVSIAQWAGRL